MKKNTKPSKEKIELEGCFSILDFIRACVAAVDKTGKIIFINKAICNQWGYPREEFIGKRFQILKILKAESLFKVTAAFAKRILGKGEAPYEIELKAKDGSERIVEVLGEQLKIKNKVIGVIATLHDVTIRKKTEEEIKKKNEELEKFKRVAVGRELQMVELKKKVKELEEKLNK
jgi:PAS domain S-box-containing protein